MSVDRISKWRELPGRTAALRLSTLLIAIGLLTGAAAADTSKGSDNRAKTVILVPAVTTPVPTPPVVPKALPAPAIANASPQVNVGDRWIYLTTDDLHGHLAGTQTFTATGRSNDRLYLTFASQPAPGYGAPSSLPPIFDANWNGIEEGATFRPYDPSSGVELPLVPGKKWQTYYLVTLASGSELTAAAETISIGWESLNLRTGLSYSTFHLHTVIALGPPGVVTGDRHVVDLWYAPAVNRFAKRTVETWQAGQLKSRVTQELAAYDPVSSTTTTTAAAQPTDSSGLATLRVMTQPVTPVTALDPFSSPALPIFFGNRPGLLTPMARSALLLAAADIRAGKYAEGLKAALPLAQQGLPTAEGLVGMLYLLGRGTVKDATQARKWLEKAASQNYAPAELGLARLYLTGDGVPKDVKHAAELTLSAAEQGDGVGEYALGTMLEFGTAFPKNMPKALFWYEAAAAQNQAEAELRLAYLYGMGKGVAKDETAEAMWYRKAAAQGNAKAQAGLGLAYLGGIGVQADLLQARTYLSQAALQGDSRGQFSLAMLYLNGWGIRKSPETAALWMRRAAEQGMPEAQFLLGLLYDEGRGVTGDHDEAVKWWGRAAAQGYAPAQQLLAAPPSVG